jgi:preprotein translocase subunit YajC
LDFAYELGLWAASLAIGFILGFFTNWYFYRKQREEGKSSIEILRQLRQFNDTVVRLGKDERGKIVKRPDGTIAIDWKIELMESVGVSATPKVEVEKKREKDKS